MRIGIGGKIRFSFVLILLVYIVSSIMVLSGILDLRDAMDNSIAKSEQVNMLFRYNTLSSRVALIAKEIMIDPDKVNDNAFMSEFQKMKSETEALMDVFLNMQKTSEDRSAAISIFSGSSELMEIIEYSLIVPLQSGEPVNFSLVNGAVNEREDILHIIDERIESLELEKLLIVESGNLQASKVVRNSLIAIGFAIFLVVITSIFLIGIIVNPVKKAALMLKEISDGEGDLSKSLLVNSRDEIGDLSNYFNQFLFRLKSIILNIKKGSENNLILEKELKDSSDRTVESIALIKSSLESMKERITQLNFNISNSTEVVSAMNRSITSLSGQVSEQSAMSEESTASVTEMIASVANVALITQKKKEAADLLKQHAGKGGEMILETVKAVELINDNIDSISALTGIISGIASQTNLLSMNAAIEAAHAGDAGRGFTVVADEIRKLAETTSVNSKEISKVLKLVIDRIKIAVEMSNKANSAFSDIEREINGVISALEEINVNTLELRSGGTQVLEAMSVLRDSSVSVKSSVNEIDSGSGAVDNAMNSVKKLADDVVGEIACISAGTENISLVADGVGRISVQLSHSAASIAEDVGKFKTEESD